MFSTPERRRGECRSDLPAQDADDQRAEEERPRPWEAPADRAEAVAHLLVEEDPAAGRVGVRRQGPGEVALVLGLKRVDGHLVGIERPWLKLDRDRGAGVLRTADKLGQRYVLLFG
jgi:hypothetical protein